MRLFVRKPHAIGESMPKSHAKTVGEEITYAASWRDATAARTYSSPLKKTSPEYSEYETNIVNRRSIIIHNFLTD